MALREKGGDASSDRAANGCAYCHQERTGGRSCTTDTITYPDGDVEPAIAYGDEHATGTATRCPGCGVDRGGYHHPFCPIEECPRCDRRLMRCGCLDTDCISRRWMG